MAYQALFFLISPSYLYSIYQQEVSGRLCSDISREAENKSLCALHYEC